MSNFFSRKSSVRQQSHDAWDSLECHISKHGKKYNSGPFFLSVISNQSLSLSVSVLYYQLIPRYDRHIILVLTNLISMQVYLLWYFPPSFPCSLGSPSKQRLPPLIFNMACRSTWSRKSLFINSFFVSFGRLPAGISSLLSLIMG